MPDVRSKLHILPTSNDAGNLVWVTGKVEFYKGQPQIVIKDVNQIEIIQNTQKELE